MDILYQALMEANTNILWEPKYEVKAVKPSMWRANQIQAASVATEELMPFFSLILCDQFSLSYLQFEA